MQARATSAIATVEVLVAWLQAPNKDGENRGRTWFIKSPVRPLFPMQTNFVLYSYHKDKNNFRGLAEL